MNTNILLVVLLPLLHACSKYSYPNLMARNLIDAITKAKRGNSSENFGDYFTDDFTYTRCIWKVNKTEFVKQVEEKNNVKNTRPILYVDMAMCNLNNLGLVFTARSMEYQFPGGYDLIGSFAVPNETLTGGYQITRMLDNRACDTPLSGDGNVYFNYEIVVNSQWGFE